MITEYHYQTFPPFVMLVNIASYSVLVKCVKTGWGGGGGGGDWCCQCHTGHCISCWSPISDKQKLHDSHTPPPPPPPPPPHYILCAGSCLVVCNFFIAHLLCANSLKFVTHVRSAKETIFHRPYTNICKYFHQQRQSAGSAVNRSPIHLHLGLTNCSLIMAEMTRNL